MTDWLTSTDIANQIGVKVRTIYKKQTTIDDWIVNRDSSELEIQ